MNHRLPREQAFRTFQRRTSYAYLTIGLAEFADEHRSLTAHLLAKHLGPNCRGRIPCPSIRRIPKQTRIRSGRRAHVWPRTPLAPDLGPYCRGRIPCPSRKRRPKEAGRYSGRWTQVCHRLRLP